MRETKKLYSCALASITTGISLINFSDIHEAAEQLMGYPIWTHQFSALFPRLREEVFNQFPDMPTDCNGAWEKTRDDVIQRYGETVLIEKGAGTNAPSPFDHIPKKFTRRRR